MTGTEFVFCRVRTEFSYNVALEIDTGIRLHFDTLIYHET
jgi:hypothetical protein